MVGPPPLIKGEVGYYQGNLKFGKVHKRVGVWALETQLLSNDPSAGSPTETLLRLLLPLDNVVRSNFQSKGTR